MHRQGEAAVREILGTVKDRHEEIVRPWELSSDKPSFNIKVSSQAGRIVGEVILSAQKATKATLSVWQLLDRGTRIRYMKLSKEGDPAGEWQSKTSPRQLTSGPGAGRKFGLDFEDPDGGIRKREFKEAVAESVADEAREKIKRAYASRT